MKTRAFSAPQTLKGRACECNIAAFAGAIHASWTQATVRNPHIFNSLRENRRPPSPLRFKGDCTRSRPSASMPSKFKRRPSRRPRYLTEHLVICGPCYSYGARRQCLRRDDEDFSSRCILSTHTTQQAAALPRPFNRPSVRRGKSSGSPPLLVVTARQYLAGQTVTI